MKTKISKLILILSICSGFCSYGQINTAKIAYRVSEKDLIPEGITYSSTTNSFYLSSIHKNKIVQINAETGGFKDFISSDLIDMSILGMIVDDRKNHLWACANKDNQSTVAKFDLKTGELLKSYMRVDTVENTFNDLVQDKEGNIYFTNTNKQTVYMIDKNTEIVSVLFDSPEILHPNGITISPDNKYLYIASTEFGIRILDIMSKKILNDPNGFLAYGLDGLKFYNNKLIGLQNEVRRNEVNLSYYLLDETGTIVIGKEIIEQNNPSYNIPTTFVIVNDRLYCLANSQMANINFVTNEIRSYETLDDVLILEYKLK